MGWGRNRTCYDSGGETCNRQVVTTEMVRIIPPVAVLTEVALKQGQEVAKEIMEKLNRTREQV